MQRLFFTISATESEIISCKDSYLQKQFDKYTFQSYDDYIVKNIKYDHFRAARSICAAAKGGTMEYRRFDNTIIARIDKGEEILEQIKAIALQENIRLASVQALGAVNHFTVGVFKTDEKKYYSNTFDGSFEIVSLTGTINTMNDEFYCHLHMSAGDDKGHVFGGHLNKAIVSATCEMVIQIIDGKVDRYFDEEIGLNLFRF